MYRIGTVAAGVVGMGSVRSCWEGVPLTLSSSADFPAPFHWSQSLHQPLGTCVDTISRKDCSISKDSSIPCPIFL